MSYRRKRVYKCDICGSEKPEEYRLGRDADCSHYGPPIGWTHTGFARGVTVCDSCHRLIDPMSPDQIVTGR